MQDDAADDLHGEMAHTEHAVGGFAADRKGVGKNVVRRLSHFQPVAQLVGLPAQLVLAHGAIGVLKGQHAVADRLDPL